MLWWGGFRGMPIIGDELRNVVYCCACTNAGHLGIRIAGLSKAAGWLRIVGMRISS